MKGKNLIWILAIVIVGIFLAAKYGLFQSQSLYVEDTLADCQHRVDYKLGLGYQCVGTCKLMSQNLIDCFHSIGVTTYDYRLGDGRYNYFADNGACSAMSTKDQNIYACFYGQFTPPEPTCDEYYYTCTGSNFYLSSQCGINKGLQGNCENGGSCLISSKTYTTKPSTSTLVTDFCTGFSSTDFCSTLPASYTSCNSFTHPACVADGSGAWSCQNKIYVANQYGVDYYFCEITGASDNPSFTACTSGCNPSTGLCTEGYRICTEGYMRCNGLDSQKCVNNAWATQQTCTGSCVLSSATYSYCTQQYNYYCYTTTQNRCTTLSTASSTPPTDCYTSSSACNSRIQSSTCSIPGDNVPCCSVTAGEFSSIVSNYLNGQGISAMSMSSYVSKFLNGQDIC